VLDVRISPRKGMLIVYGKVREVPIHPSYATHCSPGWTYA
jgi:hypothetical protein